MLLSVDLCIWVHEIIQRLALLCGIQFQVTADRELDTVRIMAAEKVADLIRKRPRTVKRKEDAVLSEAAR